MRTITVDVKGRPPTPNARRHWRTVAADNAVWKNLTWAAASEALQKAGWATKVVMSGGKRPEAMLVATEPMLFAEVEVAIVVPDERDRDWDNGVASLKPVFDGCVAAGIVVDDSIRRIPARRVEFVHRAHQSRIVIRFTEVAQPGSLGL